MDFLQERAIAWVAVQVLQQGVHFGEDQTAVTLGISPLQPLESFVGLVPESVDLGNLVGRNVRILVDQRPKRRVSRNFLRSL